MCGLRTHQHTFFSRRVWVVQFWGQWGCDQDDHQSSEVQRRDMMSSAHRVENAWLNSTESIWNQDDSKSSYDDTKKQTCWHFNQRDFHAWRVEPSSSFDQTWWISWCSLAAMAAISDPIWMQSCHVKERSSCDFQWGLHRWRNQNQWSPANATHRQLECHTTREARGTILSRIWDIKSIRVNAARKDKVAWLVQGDLYGPPKAQKSNVLNWGDIHRRLVIRCSDSKSRVFKTLRYSKKSQQDEGLPFHAQEVGDYSRTLNISSGSIEDKCVAVGNVHVFVNESSPFILNRIILANLEVYKNTNFEQIQSFVNITQKLIFGAFWRYSEYECDCKWLSFRATSPTLSLDQVILRTRAKVRVYSDSVLCLEKMYADRDALQDGRVKWNPKCPPLTKNSWESMDSPLNSWRWFSHGFSSLQILQKNPDWFARTAHWTWKIHRPDHLHVNVQRHRLDKKRTRWNLCFELRKGEGMGEKILARPQDVRRSWRWKEVVWNSSLHIWR